MDFSDLLRTLALAELALQILDQSLNPLKAPLLVLLPSLAAKIDLLPLLTLMGLKYLLGVNLDQINFSLIFLVGNFTGQIILNPKLGLPLV